MPKIEPVEGKSAAISADIDTFIAEMTKSSTPRSSGTGRLIFALDATASRNETWDMACQLQGDMFQAVASVGGLSVQLVYYRNLSECRSSRLGYGYERTDQADDAHPLSRWPDPDQQGSRPRQARDWITSGLRARLRRRRMRGGRG